MLVERARPLAKDWLRTSTPGGIVRLGRSSSVPARFHTVADDALPALEHAARFWKTINHPSHVRVSEVGLLEGEGYFIVEPQQLLYEHPVKPLPLPRVLVFVEDLLEVLSRGLACVDDDGRRSPLLAHLDGMQRIWTDSRQSRRLQILVGDPNAASLARRDHDDVHAVQALARAFIGTAEAFDALPKWGARLFKDNGLTVSELLAAVRKAFEGPAAGLMRLDEVRQRVSAPDLTHQGPWIARLLSSAPEYARVSGLTALMWRGLRKPLTQALHAEAIEAWHLHVLLLLPEAETLLLDVVGDADVPEHPRVFAAHVLAGRRDAEATEALTAVLNEPLFELRTAAWRALALLMPAPHLAADTKRVRVVACQHAWDTLEPIDAVDGRARSYCAECAKTVVAVEDVEALRSQLDGCAFFEPPPPPRSGHVIG